MTFLQIFTLFHTTLSVVAIIAGLLVVKGLIASHGRQLWTLLFLYTAAATTLTGFFFSFHGVTPALVLGVVSLIPLTLAFAARYRHRLEGAWRGAYVVSVVTTLYFNCFVLIVQAFQKIPSLNALAPTQSEPPFQIAQLATLALFIAAGVVSFKNYHPKRLTDELATTYISPLPEPE
jgi:hypothetical protein